jgi:tetratricopeptide (TPR) repeat protein
MGRRGYVVFIFLILSTVPSLSESTSWVEVRSEHFTVISDNNEKQAIDVARRFEQMRNVFSELFNKSRVSLPVPLQIVAFQSREEFRQYSPQWKGKAVELSGFYQGSDDRNFIGIDMSSPDPYGTALHEYAHLLLRASFPVMPLWFDEGFAEYFATMQVQGKQVQYGAPATQYLPLLTNGTWMPLTALFSVERNSDVYNENDKRSMFYAESWLAVHYLLSSGRLVDGFKYLHLTQIQHVPVPDAVKQAFGVDVPTFEKTLHEYLTKPQPPQQLAISDSNEGTYHTTKLSSSNTRAILADMHAHSEAYAAQAVGELQAVLAADPGNEVANRALGYVYVRKGEFERAAAAFQKALAANDNDAQAHYLVAYLMNSKALKDGRPPDQSLAMRRELERAIQLDPGLADAHNLLAYALAADNKPDMAVQEEMKAIALNPSAEMYQANLAHLYLQSNRLDDAEAVLTRLQGSSDSKIRDNATQNLAALKANRETAQEQKKSREIGYTDPTAPQWKAPAEPDDSPAPAESTPASDTRKTLYMYAELVSVDCSQAPVAILTVRKGPKSMKLRTDDYKKLLVMNADSFSCGWRDRKVLVNYKPGGKSDGDLMTLEIETGK